MTPRTSLRPGEAEEREKGTAREVIGRLMTPRTLLALLTTS